MIAECIKNRNADADTDSQEVIDASFELGSSSLGLGSFDQIAKRLGGESQFPSKEVKLENVVRYSVDASEARKDGGDEKLEQVAKVLNLLEVALHAILHFRQVYPEELFSRRKKFGNVAFQCTDIAIGEYISEILHSIAHEILNEEVERLIINIHQMEEVIESFIFVFSYDQAQLSEKLNLEDVSQEKQLQSLLRKINAMDALLEPLPSCGELTFSVLMQTRSKSEGPGSLAHASMGKPEISAFLIQMITFLPFELSLYVQQVEAKDEVKQAGSLEL